MKFNKYLALSQIIVLLLFGLFFIRSKKPSEIKKTDLPKNTIKKNSKILHVKKVTDVIHYGESLWDIFRKHNVFKDDINPAINEFKKIYNPRKIRTGDRYQIIQDSLHQLLSYAYQPNISSIYKVEKDSSGNFSGRIENRPLDRRIQTLSGTVHTSLYESILEHGETPELIIDFTDIFQWDIDFFIEPRSGDSYKMVYEAFYLDDEFVRYGRILAAQYSLSGKIFTAFYYDDKDIEGGYYDWEGKSFQKTFLKSPLNYRRITSYFSLGRRHPILKRVRPHYGIDYAAAAGTPVVASADGIVIETGYRSGGVGRYIKIKHTKTHFVTLYGHLRAYARGIKKGVKVTQRQVIGYVGTTGLATGPHLHYTFYENGRPINPLRIRNISADPLPSEKIPGFRANAHQLLKKLSDIPDGNFAWDGRSY